jgi:hypothetical protein
LGKNIKEKKTEEGYHLVVSQTVVCPDDALVVRNILSFYTNSFSVYETT